MSQQGHQVGTGRTTTDLSGRRGRVLSAIRAADTPASIESLAAELDLHPNTVRFHTSALEEAGLIEQGREQTGNKGRPRAVFVPTSEGARSGARNYQLLAAVLVDQLAQASPEPLAMARSAGRSWGEALASSSTPNRRRRSPAGEVVALLDEMGFEPEARPQRLPQRIELHNCPFRELVDEHQPVVCAIHQGLLDGIWGADQINPDHEQQAGLRLQPFAAPGVCAIHLAGES
ncbi:MAG: helix-turn-helix domain-containing protein [Nocardioidaceae bacterium]